MFCCMEETKIVAYFNGQLGEEESLKVEAWAAESEKNRKLMEQIYYALQLADRAHHYEQADVERALAQFRRDVERKRRYGKERQRTWWQRYGWQVAAFFTGVVVCGMMMLALLGNPAPYEVSTGRGQRAEVFLPDGSKVWLNSSTHLIYRSGWLSGRNVKLQGEAYFEVKHSDWEQFEVTSSKGVRTRVLGTKFNVRARDAERRVMTTLFEGSVNMYRNADDQVGRRLKPGQTMMVDTETGNMELRTYTSPEEMLCWINGEMRFQERSLGDIALCLEKVYGVKFTFTRPALRDERFTGFFKTDDPLDGVLHTLALTHHFSYRIEGEQVTIQPYQP